MLRLEHVCVRWSLSVCVCVCVCVCVRYFDSMYFVIKDINKIYYM